MKLTISLNKAEILQRVKVKAHKKGVTDLASKGNDAAKLAYNEQAGDDDNDQFLLMSSLRDSVGHFKSFIAEYVPSDQTLKADNISDTLSDTSDNFTIELSVSERFNRSMLQSLTDAASKYITDDMLMDWYIAIDVNQSKIYAELLKADEANIVHCFFKVAPAVPQHKFYDSIKVNKPGTDVLSFHTEDAAAGTYLTTYWKVGQEATVKIEEKDGYINDIVCEVMKEDDDIMGLELTKQNNYRLFAKKEGECEIKLYSRHNPKVCLYASVIINLTGTSDDTNTDS